MSWQNYKKIWQMKNLSPGRRLVLLAFGDHANEHGRNAYPSIETVAKKAGMGKRAVQVHVSALRENGVLIVRRHASGGRSMPTTYDIDFERAYKIYKRDESALGKSIARGIGCTEEDRKNEKSGMSPKKDEAQKSALKTSKPRTLIHPNHTLTTHNHTPPPKSPPMGGDCEWLPGFEVCADYFRLLDQEITEDDKFEFRRSLEDGIRPTDILSAVVQVQDSFKCHMDHRPISFGTWLRHFREIEKNGSDKDYYFLLFGPADDTRDCFDYPQVEVWSDLP